MKNYLLTLVTLVSLALTACAQNNKKGNNKMSNTNNKKTLVAYFSATGTTKQAAEALAKAANADLFEIEPTTPYSYSDLNWQDKNSRSTIEMKDLSYRPSIKHKLKNAEQYDIVYIGFPIWWYTAPTIINTFIEQTNLTGKRLIIFATSGGSTTKKSVQDMKKQYPKLSWEDGGLLNRGSIEEATQLVKKITP